MTKIKGKSINKQITMIFRVGLWC